VSAGQAQAKVHPGRADRQALIAALRSSRGHRPQLREKGTGQDGAHSMNISDTDVFDVDELEA
jgi:hypothetical protein